MGKGKKEQGQSTIEFLLCFIFSFGVFFMFLFLALNATSGQLAHYATYMASRTYLVFDNYGQSNGAYAQAEAMAQKTFDFYQVDKYIMIKDQELHFNHLHRMPTRRSKLFVGPYLTFKQRFYIFLIGENKDMEMISESFLGKEPIRHECYQRISDMMNLKYGVNPNQQQSIHTTLFDNGC